MSDTVHSHLFAERYHWAQMYHQSARDMLDTAKLRERSVRPSSDPERATLAFKDASQLVHIAQERMETALMYLHAAMKVAGGGDGEKLVQIASESMHATRTDCMDTIDRLNTKRYEAGK